MKYSELKYDGFTLLVITREDYKQYLKDMYNAHFTTPDFIVFIKDRMIETIEVGYVWGINVDEYRNGIEIMVNRKLMLEEI